MWFDDAEPVQPQILFNAWGDHPRLDQFGEESRPVDRWPLASDFHPFALRPDIDSGMMHVRHNDGVGSLASGRWQPDFGTYDTILKSSTATEPENGPIVVTGTRISGGDIVWTHATGGDPGGLTGPTGEITPPNEGEPPPPDENEIIITVQLNRTLTPSEQEVLQNLQNAISAIDAAIRSLSDNARITLYDGSIVTGAELKALWSKTDFTINPDNTYYGTTNPQNRGAAIYNGGDPQVFVNLWVLQGYDAQPENSGLNFFVGHELGHLTQANRDHDGTAPDAAIRYEQMANDISRAIADSAGISVLPATGTSAPEYGYSTPTPLVFS